MIPEVALTDTLFVLLSFAWSRFAPTPRTRRLLVALSSYCVIETLFHVPMENFAGQVMSWFF